LQELRDVDRRGLQEHILLAGASAAAAPLDPKNSVLVSRFHDERQLRLQFIHATNEIKRLFRLLRYQVKLGRQARERVHHREEFVAVLSHEFSARREREARIALWQQRKKELRPLAQVGASLQHRSRQNILLPQRVISVTRQVFKTQIADCHAEVASRHV